MNNKFKTFIIICIVYVCCYAFLNNIVFFSPTELFLFNFEKQIPLMPNFIWIYLSVAIMVPMVFFFTKDNFLAKKFIWSFNVLIATSFICFLFFPTIYPRHNYPTNSEILHFFWVNLDQPVCCFPSLHVGGAILAAVVSWYQRKFYYIVWAILIAISTLTLKQHYFIDVMAGSSIAIISFYTSKFFVR